MINEILESISISLNAEFGDRYKIYREKKKQGLTEPCFFISCINPANRLFLEKKYFRRNQFCIQYFPEHRGKEKEECYRIAERLFQTLECVKVDGAPVRGTQMNFELDDGILHFFVNYDMFVYKADDPNPVMEEVLAETNVKREEVC